MSRKTRALLWLTVGSIGLLAALPTGANAALLNWSAPMAIDSGHAIDSLACPTSSLCVAGGSNGAVLASTNPAGGATAWSTSAIDESWPVESLSCPGSTLCVGVDYYGHVLTSTDPVGGAAAWHQSERLEISLMDVSCGSSSFCAITQQNGEFFYSSEPANEAWFDTGEVSATGFDEQGLSCPNATLCLAASASSDARPRNEVLTATEPTEGPTAWSGTTPDPSGIHGIDCVSTSFCTAVNGAGEMLTTTAPTSGTWTPHNLGVPVLAVKCASTAFCVASEANGNLLESTEPNGAASAWTTIHDVAPLFGYITHIDCVSATFCIAADYEGNVYVADPSIPPRYRLTVSEEGTGDAIVTSSPAGIDCNGGGGECSREYAGGTVVTLTGSGHEGEHFDGWTGGGCSGTGLCQVTIDADTEVTAHVSLEEEDQEEPSGGNPGGGGSPTTTPTAQLPAPTPAPIPAPKKPRHKHRALTCHKGFKKQKVHGKAKCVKVKRKSQRHR